MCQKFGPTISKPMYARPFDSSVVPSYSVEFLIVVGLRLLGGDSSSPQGFLTRDVPSAGCLIPSETEGVGRSREVTGLGPLRSSDPSLQSGTVYLLSSLSQFSA